MPTARGVLTPLPTQPPAHPGVPSTPEPAEWNMPLGQGGRLSDQKTYRVRCRLFSNHVQISLAKHRTGRKGGSPMTPETETWRQRAHHQGIRRTL